MGDTGRRVDASPEELAAMMTRTEFAELLRRGTSQQILAAVRAARSDNPATAARCAEADALEIVQTADAMIRGDGMYSLYANIGYNPTRLPKYYARVGAIDHGECVYNANRK